MPLNGRYLLYIVLFSEAGIGLQSISNTSILNLFNLPDLFIFLMADADEEKKMKAHRELILKRWSRLKPRAGLAKKCLQGQFYKGDAVYTGRVFPHAKWLSISSGSEIAK